MTFKTNFEFVLRTARIAAELQRFFVEIKDKIAHAAAGSARSLSDSFLDLLR